VLVVNFGFISREESKFSISCVLVVLSTCAAESLYLAMSVTKGSWTSLFQIFTCLLTNETPHYALSLFYLQMVSDVTFRSTYKIFMLNICKLMTTKISTSSSALHGRLAVPRRWFQSLLLTRNLEDGEDRGKRQQAAPALNGLGKLSLVSQAKEFLNF